MKCERSYCLALKIFFKNTHQIKYLDKQNNDNHLEYIFNTNRFNFYGGHTRAVMYEINGGGVMHGQGVKNY